MPCCIRCDHDHLKKACATGFSIHCSLVDPGVNVFRIMKVVTLGFYLSKFLVGTSFSVILIVS